MIPKKKLGSSRIPFKGSYHEMIKQIDTEHQRTQGRAMDWTEARNKLNQAATASVSKSAEPVESPTPGTTSTDEPEAPTASSPSASLATPQGLKLLEQSVEDELWKMRRVLIHRENQDFVTNNFRFLTTMVVQVICNLYSEDFNVVPKNDSGNVGG